jgi:hypothetical protein
MGPSRVDPRTGQILDADILFDDAYVRFQLQEYRVLIREVPTAMLGRRGREVLKLHPLNRLGIVPAADEFADSIPDDAVRQNTSPYLRRAFCSIGHGSRHQLGCCSLVFAGPKPADGNTPATNEIPSELLDQFVKDTVMHEVGHTLGLRHNFKASTYRTLDDINSEEKPDDVTASVMDYSPIIIAPDGRPQGNWAMRTIGPYDYWAIEYGYTPDEKALPKVVSRVAEKGLAFATDEDTWSHDPYVSRWDMGADPLAYAQDRVALMKRIRKDLEARAVDKGERYHRLRRALDMQFFEGRWAASIAVRFVGGEHIHRDHRGDPNARPPLVPVSAAKQRDALNFLCDEFLSGRYFEIDGDLLKKVAPDFWVDDFLSFFLQGHEYPYLENCLAVQMQIAYALTSPSRLGRVLDAKQKLAKGEDVLTIPEVFEAIEKTIFGDVKAAVSRATTNQEPALSEHQRNLQREYISHLIFILLKGDGFYPAPVQTLARFYVKELAGTLEEAAAAARQAGADTYTRAHLDECHTRLARALEASYTLTD